MSQPLDDDEKTRLVITGLREKYSILDAAYSAGTVFPIGATDRTAVWRARRRAPGPSSPIHPSPPEMPPPQRLCSPRAAPKENHAGRERLDSYSEQAKKLSEIVYRVRRVRVHGPGVQRYALAVTDYANLSSASGRFGPRFSTSMSQM